MDHLKQAIELLVQAMDHRTEVENRKADALFAIAQALTPPGDEDDEIPDPPMRGLGMGMG